MNDNFPCKTQRFSYDVFFTLGGGGTKNTARKGGSRNEERQKRKEGRGKRERRGGEFSVLLNLCESKLLDH